MMAMVEQRTAAINGKPYVLSFDNAAVMCLEKEYGYQFADLQKLFDEARGNPKAALVSMLTDAFTRSLDEPPTKKEMERIQLHEYNPLAKAILYAFGAALNGNSAGERSAPTKQPVTAGARKGTGKKNSSRR